MPALMHCSCCNRGHTVCFTAINMPTVSAETWIPCPGVTCPTCAEKDAEIEKVSIAHKVVSRVLSERLKEIAKLNAIYYDACRIMAEKDAEIARLTALVAVGREMADHLDKLFGPHFPSDLAKKWRSLEGER